MKKIAILTIICALLLSLIACGETTYEPVASTDEEATTVMTLSVGDKKYDVKYELYRAFFLGYKDEVSGGDDSVWSSSDKEKYIEEIDSLILADITAIYSCFAICEDIGFDIYSLDVEKQINGFIKDSVEGGESGTGYGTYEKYLAELKKMNLNYSVQTLLFRYAIASAAIDEHYIGTVSADDINGSISVGSIEYTKEDVKAYYESDECVRVLRAHIQAAAYYEPKERAETVRENMLKAVSSGDDAVAAVIINSGLTAPTEVKNGYLMGKHNLDSLYYSEMTDAAFKLEVGDVSPVVDVKNETERILYILYRTEKSDEHFEECYHEIAYVYLTNIVGGIIDETRAALKESAEYTDALKNMDRSSITME